MGHVLVVAIVKGINDNVATKIPNMLPSNPFNLISPNHKRKIPNKILTMASTFPTFFFISISFLIDICQLCTILLKMISF